MASNLKVVELREQLAQRGLSTAGVKAVLAERLDDALREESKTKEVLDSKKRSRDCSDENGDLKKLKSVDEFQQMTVKQLREEASRRGLASTGTKKELLERLSNDLDEESNSAVNARNDKEEDNAKEEIEEEKIVIATKKGAAVLDQWLPDDIKNQYHVLQMGDEIYDAMLNQTNVKDNNNKFFIIQVLESDSNKLYMVYTRWGRVGVKGQSKLEGPFNSPGRAIAIFTTKFFDKTKNYWYNRKEFICHPKCYAWLEMDYSGKEDDSDVKPQPSSEVQPSETKLEPRIASFISLICNVSMMAQHMMEIGYNAKKLPLGKLSKSTISKGYEVLKRIAEVIGKPNRLELEELSGEFYTVIPHDFGFRKMREFVIDTPQKLKQKLDMVEALGEIELATKLLSDNTGMQEDPLYSQYQRLNCDLTPVDVKSEEFSMIEKYMENTHAKTHSSYTVDIVQVFRTSRADEAGRFQKFSGLKNRMLLWHGSRLTNWTGILSQGLRIAPPEAPSTGYMFGKGVYFADMFSKSANYCYSSSHATDGVLLLCEVALGHMAELLNANYSANQLPPGKLSTKGVGKTAPNPSEAQVLEDGVVVPLGKPVDQAGPKGTLLYNEYIVYNVEQIRMRYLLHVKFNYKY